MAEWNESMKMMAAGTLILAALAMGCVFLNPQAPPAGPGLQLGAEINMQTFASILTDAKNVSIVTDLRHANDSTVRRNVQLCGTDFAGSIGMGDKNKTVYSIESDASCVAGWEENGNFTFRNYTAADCLTQAGNAVVIMVQPGNETHFYTNAMVVGIGLNYSGECGVR